MKRLVLSILCALILLPVTAHADFYMKTKITTSGLAGLGGTKGKTESWISGNKHVEMTKIEVTSPLMKPFMKGTETYTITDLDAGLITHVNKKDKTYTELSFEEMKAQIEEAKTRAQNAYGEAKKDMEDPMPKVDGGEIRIETQSTGETKTFAGLKSERTKLILRSTGKDEKTGEEVTFKIVYDAWMTPELPGGAERDAYFSAYAKAFQIDLEDQALEGDMSIHTALTSAGMSPSAMAPHLEALKGYPTKFTIHLGTELTDKQRQELQEAMKAEKKEGGGGFSLGGFSKKIQKAVGDKLSDALVKEFFAAGVTMDENGDPIFFSMTSELEKISTKSEPKKFVIPEDYKKLN